MMVYEIYHTFLLSLDCLSLDVELWPSLKISSVFFSWTWSAFCCIDETKDGANEVARNHQCVSLRSA